MILATLNNGTREGALIVVSRDYRFYAFAPVPTMQALMEDWEAQAPALAAISEFPETLNVSQLLAPMPRAWQWLDGSVYASHGALMNDALGIKVDKPDCPLMYQGVSDTFYAPTQDVPMVDPTLGIDFEGEFGIITDAVPAGISTENAAKHIRLLVQINDWSLRALSGPEMKTGFGWIQAKPPCSMAPFAITPDELGDAWRNARPCLHLRVHWNGTQFGDAYGEPMEYGFDRLVSHAARTRNLVAGTVIGSGTVSNENFREVGSTCIAERRGIEIVDEGAAKTEFMKIGDTVRMEAHLPDGRKPFGVIDQRVVQG